MEHHTAADPRLYGQKQEPTPRAADSGARSHATASPVVKTVLTDNVFLFVPNLIGYGRVITAAVSFYYMPFDYPKAVFWYLLSGLLDAVDGHAARYLNQTSRVGALLDMLTDRCATLCLIMMLGYFYPRWMFAFQLICTVDVASHWMHMYAAMLHGRLSHKAVDLMSHPVLRIYYSSRPVLFFMCAGNELFYTMLYLCHFTKGPALFGIGLFQLLCAVCMPVALVKLGISIVQMVAALRNVGQVDQEERQKLGITAAARVASPQSSSGRRHD